MDPKNRGLEDGFPFKLVIFSFHVLILRGVHEKNTCQSGSGFRFSQQAPKSKSENLSPQTCLGR